MKPTIIDKINNATSGAEFLKIFDSSILELEKYSWENSTASKLSEIKLHCNFWKEGKFLSELKNTKRIEVMINYIDDLEVRVNLRAELKEYTPNVHLELAHA